VMTQLADPWSLNSPTFAREIQTLVCIGAAAVLLGVALATLDTPTHAIVWGSLALAAYAASMLFLAGFGRRGLGLTAWKFGPWILLWYGVAFGLATITWIQPQQATAAQIDISDVLLALFMVAVGMTFLMFGYLVGPGEWARNFAVRMINNLGRRFTGEIRSLRAPWILYSIGVAARLGSTAATGRFGYVGDVASAESSASSYGQILSMLSLCAPLAVAGAALLAYRERRRSATGTLLVLFITELIFGAVAGGKESFVVAVLAVVIPVSSVRFRLPKPAIIVGIAGFLVVVVPFNLAYRSMVRSGSTSLTPSEAAHAAPGILRQVIHGDESISVVLSSFDFLAQRSREIDSPAVILQRTPAQIPFASPLQLLEAPLADVVPRAVWPGKPILATGYQFSQQYFGLPSTVYTSSAITPIGDLYRHGGWLEVLVGMFLLGCIVRLFDDSLDVRSNPHAIFLVLLLFPALVKSEDDWITMLAGIPGTIVFWLVAVCLTFKRRHP
jgi:hypothetical protein